MSTGGVSSVNGLSDRSKTAVAPREYTIRLALDV